MRFIFRNLSFMVGGIMVLCAVVGIFLPVVPTVPFIIAAAWCFSRSSPRFNRWLHRHPLFGPPLVRWEKSGAISLPAKIVAVISMAAGFVIFCLLLQPALWLAAAVLLVLLCSAAFVVSRPSQ